jgi:hypothetical protein
MVHRAALAQPSTERSNAMLRKLMIPTACAIGLCLGAVTTQAALNDPARTELTVACKTSQQVVRFMGLGGLGDGSFQNNDASEAISRINSESGGDACLYGNFEFCGLPIQPRNSFRVMKVRITGRWMGNAFLPYRVTEERYIVAGRFPQTKAVYSVCGT